MHQAELTDIEIYKEFADPVLYEQLDACSEVTQKSAAQHLWADLQTIQRKLQFMLPENVTAEDLRELNVRMIGKAEGSLEDLVNKAMTEAIQHYLDFVGIRRTEKFREEYQAYLDDPESFID